MIFWRLHDFFFSLESLRNFFCVERLRFVDRLNDFLCGEVA